MGRSTWWRRLGGLVAACLLVVLASAPSIDAIVCQDDAQITSVTQTSTVAADATAAPASAPQRGDVGDICPHGHCHHVAAEVPKDPVRHVLPVFVEVRSGALAQRFPPSLPGATPERPPRV